MPPPFMAPPVFANQGFPHLAPNAAPYAGSCFNCNQYGHMARDCPFPHRNYASQGRGVEEVVGDRCLCFHLEVEGGRSGRRGKN